MGCRLRPVEGATALTLMGTRKGGPFIHAVSGCLVARFGLETLYPLQGWCCVQGVWLGVFPQGFEGLRPIGSCQHARGGKPRFTVG